MSNQKISIVKVDEIFLDEDNPRLPTTVSRKQNDMLLYIARNTSITELMSAIAENDYFPGEPLVVVPRKKGGYIAVEGNRRLTALKLLQDPSLYPKNAKVREISNDAIHRPTSVPVVVFDNREQVLNYLGYRHITGVKQWEPLAKARYIASYFDNHTNDKSTAMDRYKEVARGIGSQWTYIKRQLDGLAFYRHIESKQFYKIEGLNEESVAFSLITTSLGYDTILSYVSEVDDVYLNPKKLKGVNVEHLTRLMFEPNEKGETDLGDSRNIKKLALIVSDATALTVLIKDKDIDRAYAETKGISEDFYDLLNTIEGKLSEAVSSVALINLDEGHLNKITNIFKQARLLRTASEG